jgi:hypothetical protein
MDDDIEKEHVPRKILSLSILDGEPLVFDTFVRHPVIRIHVMDEKTHMYRSKIDLNQPGIKSIEKVTTLNWEARSCPFISPLITNPSILNRQNFPCWDETFYINESYEHLISPEVIFIFELMEFDQPMHMEENGWFPLAWTFMRGRTLGKIKPKTTVCLQLYQIPSSYKKSMILENWPPSPCFPLGYYLYLLTLGINVPVPSTDVTQYTFGGIKTIEKSSVLLTERIAAINAELEKVERSNPNIKRSNDPLKRRIIHPMPKYDSTIRIRVSTVPQPLFEVILFY